MDNITITASITYSQADIEAFADRLGYQTQIQNPAYSESFDGTQIVTNGEPQTITNPQSKIDFVKEQFKTKCAKPWFTQFASDDAKKTAEELAKKQIATLEANLEAAIQIT